MLHFNIYDHFGLDIADMDAAKDPVSYEGFRAWFILQHYKGYNGKYKPFPTVIEIDIPFEGVIN